MQGDRGKGSGVSFQDPAPIPLGYPRARTIEAKPNRACYHALLSTPAASGIRLATSVPFSFPGLCRSTPSIRRPPRMEGLRRLHRPRIHATCFPLWRTRSVTQERSLMNKRRMSRSPVFPLPLLGLDGRRAAPRSLQLSHTGRSRRVTVLPGHGICRRET